MKNLTEINFEKSRSGVYKDNSENRRLHRVGQRYGSSEKESEKGNEERIIKLKKDIDHQYTELDRFADKREKMILQYGEEFYNKKRKEIEDKIERNYEKISSLKEKGGANDIDNLKKDKKENQKFTRANLPDIPNAHKVNLKKYLSAKRKAAVDEAWSKVNFDNLSAGMLRDSYNKMRDAFNNNFDSMSKSERAEQLYRILKVKNAMEKGRGPNNLKNSVSEVLTPNNPLAKYIDTTKIPRPRPGARYVVKQGQPPRTLVKVLDYHSGIGGYGVTVEYRGDGDEKTGTETIDRDVFTRIFYNYKKLGNKK